MNEFFEGCNHDCEFCNFCDDCYYANENVDAFRINESQDFLNFVIKDMVEEEVWNKETLQFETRFVYEDKQKYWRKSYRKRKSS